MTEDKGEVPKAFAETLSRLKPWIRWTESLLLESWNSDQGDLYRAGVEAERARIYAEVKDERREASLIHVPGDYDRGYDAACGQILDDIRDAAPSDNRAEREKYERFPCGHVKEWDDSYGSCRYCDAVSYIRDYDAGTLCGVEGHPEVPSAPPSDNRAEREKK